MWLKLYCASIKLLPLHPRRAKLASQVGLLTGEALTLPYYRNRKLAAWAKGLADAGASPRPHAAVSSPLRLGAQSEHDRFPV